MISGCEPSDGQGRLDDRAGLHGGDFRIGDAQPAAAVAQHGVELVQGLDLGLDLLDGDAHGLGHFLLAGFIVRQELVQRRVQEADGRRAAIQGLEDADEVLALERQQLGQGLFAAGDVIGQDHLAHRDDAVAFEEHVLGAGQADALGAEAGRPRRCHAACRRWCGRPACGTCRPAS